MNPAQDFAHYFIPRFSSFHYVPELTESKNPSINQYYEKLSDSAQNVIFITGRGTQKQKNETLEKLKAVPADESLIILATGKYAGEGFDYPRIDTLMLAKMKFKFLIMLIIEFLFLIECIRIV